jgi:diguanylate cyclase (GGDEF)-like protein
MTGPASPPPTGAPAPTLIDELLQRAQTALDAAFVAVRANEPQVSRSVSGSRVGVRVLEDLWRHGADGLLEQVCAAQDAIGTNKLRGDSNGPVCGKLIAAPLRNPAGTIIGLLAALRTVEQGKFTSAESQVLGEFAQQLGSLLTPAQAPSGALLNPGTLKERVSALESAAGAVPGCILYGNVDQLHVLNKLAGFATGDQAIAAVGATLKEGPLPEGAGVCHIDGDRFAIYLPKTTLIAARRTADQLSRAVTAGCASIGGLRTRLTMSFGVAALAGGDSLDAALEAAESACRAAKTRGRGRVEVHHAPETSPASHEEATVANRLRKALETERIGIVAQPLVSLTGDTRVEYHEVVARVVSDTGSFVGPAQFTSAAARYQMLVDLDRALLIRLFDRLKAARAYLSTRTLRFCINLSGPAIGAPEFLEWLSSNIGPNGVPGEWLQLGITETAAVAHASQTQALIDRLRTRDVQFALDDFGTGVGSFGYLKSFDVSMLKLDESFTRDALTNSRSEALVRGIAQLGRSMAIQTAAKGVQTEAERARLAELGVDHAQGALFGQPVPLESLLAAPEAAAAPEPVSAPDAPAGATLAAAADG